MKTSNIFKFVSVRPAQKFTPEWILTESKAADELDKEIRQKEKANKQPSVKGGRPPKLLTREELLVAVGSDIMQSPRYYLNDKLFLSLQDLWPDFEQLVDQQKTTIDIQEFKDVAMAIFLSARNVNGELADMPADVEVQDMLHSLWLSYYVNFLNFEERPGDREEISNWVKLFDLLSNLGNEVDFERAVKLWDKKRLSLPENFYAGISGDFDAESKNSEGQSITEEKNRKVNDTTLRTSIRELRALERKVQGIIETKKNKLATWKSVPPPPNNQPVRRNSFTGTIVVMKTQYITVVPWKITLTDFVSKVDQAIIAKYQLTMPDQDVFDLLNQIENKIAVFEAELEMLNSTSSISLVGSLFQLNR